MADRKLDPVAEYDQRDDDYARTALPILLTYSQQVLDGVDLPKIRRVAYRAGDTWQVALLDALIAARTAYVNYEKHQAQPCSQPTTQTREHEEAPVDQAHL